MRHVPVSRREDKAADAKCRKGLKNAGAGIRITAILGDGVEESHRVPYLVHDHTLPVVLALRGRGSAIDGRQRRNRYCDDCRRHAIERRDPRDRHRRDAVSEQLRASSKINNSRVPRGARLFYSTRASMLRQGDARKRIQPRDAMA